MVGAFRARAGRSSSARRVVQSVAIFMQEAVGEEQQTYLRAAARLLYPDLLRRGLQHNIPILWMFSVHSRYRTSTAPARASFFTYLFIVTRMDQRQKNTRKMYGNVLHFYVKTGAVLLGIKTIAALVAQATTDVAALDAEALRQPANTVGVTRTRAEVKQEAATKAEALRGLVVVLS